MTLKIAKNANFEHVLKLSDDGSGVNDAVSDGVSGVSDGVCDGVSDVSDSVSGVSDCVSNISDDVCDGVRDGVIDLVTTLVIALVMVFQLKLGALTFWTKLA